VAPAGTVINGGTANFNATATTASGTLSSGNLSGSGTLALLSDLVKQLGPDHLIVRMAGTIYGSTETTFYVIAVYFGAVGVKRTRHAVPAGLIADAVGVAASVVICRLVFGGG